jgi:hypothetical protein
MTQESYPSSDDYKTIEILVESYLIFIEALVSARKVKIDNEILSGILDLFYTVKTDSQTIKELKRRIEEIKGLVEE